MNCPEKKISLVGWGTDQVILHVIKKEIFLSVWEKQRMKLFSDAPWLHGRVAVIKSKTVYDHSTAKSDQMRLVLSMRKDAMADAIDAIYSQNINLLAEAVIGTYLANKSLARSRWRISENFVNATPANGVCTYFRTQSH
jgi:hypothetical protein